MSSSSSSPYYRCSGFKDACGDLLMKPNYNAGRRPAHFNVDPSKFDTFPKDVFVTLGGGGVGR